MWRCRPDLVTLWTLPRHLLSSRPLGVVIEVSQSWFSFSVSSPRSCWSPRLSCPLLRAAVAQTPTAFAFLGPTSWSGQQRRSAGTVSKSFAASLTARYLGRELGAQGPRSWASMESQRARRMGQPVSSGDQEEAGSQRSLKRVTWLH